MDTDFAKITVEVMQSYDLTEAELADRLKVSQPSVHRIKTGETKNPGFSVGRALVEMHATRPEAPQKSKARA